jgi:hypothetical protein
MSIPDEIKRIQDAKASMKTAIESKGVEVGDVTIDIYASKINKISVGSGDNTDLIRLIDRTIREFNIPEGMTTIGAKAFSNCDSMHTITIPESVTYIGAEAFKYSGIGGELKLPTNLTTLGTGSFARTNITKVVIPNSITSLSANVFDQCYKLTDVTIHNNVTSIGGQAFRQCGALTEITIPEGITKIETQCFWGCPALETVNLPSTLTSFVINVFDACTNLKYVTLGNGKETFNCDNVRLSYSKLYSKETILSWFDALVDRKALGLSAYTLVIGPDNLAKVSDEEKAIATSKGWNLA